MGFIPCVTDSTALPDYSTDNPWYNVLDLSVFWHLRAKYSLCFARPHFQTC